MDRPDLPRLRKPDAESRHVSRHPHADYFHEYMNDTYVAHAAMMLRKHIKKEQRSISLASLAEDMINNSDLVAWTQPVADFEHLLGRFTTCARKIEGFADRVIAHRDQRQPTHTPTYDEIGEAISAMDALSIQCSLLVGGDYQGTCKPTAQYGWLRIFREMDIET